MRRSITAQFTLVLALVSVVVLAGFAVVIVSAESLRSADRARSRSSNALTTGNQLEQAVLDLETGLRGYLLAGKPVFLEPYQEALVRYRAIARSLEAVTGDDTAAHRTAVSIAAAIRSYVTSWTEPVIRTAQGGDLAGARRAEAGGAGKARVDAMRSQFATLLAHETTLHSEEVEQSSNLAGVVLGAGIVAVGLFALLLALVATRTEARVVAPLRRLAGAAAAVARGDLSARVPEGGTAEVGELVSGFNRMAGSIERQHRELQDRQAEVESQRDELEEALTSVEERTDRIERLRRFGDRLAAEGSVEAVVSATLRGIADAGGCDIGAAYLLDSESDCFVPVAWRGLQRGDLPLAVRPGEGLAGRALVERRRVDASGDTATMQTTALAERRAAVRELHVPILHGERALGVISLGRLRTLPFSDAEVVFMGDLADRAGVDWAQALATRRLERTAEELGAVLETTDEGVYGIDTAGEVTLVNRAALELTGYSREELLGHNAHALLHHAHEDGSRYPEEDCPIVRSFQTGEGVRITGEVFWRRDGTPFPVEYSAYPLFHEGDITGAVVTFLDRTARRQVQRQRDTQHALTRVFAAASSLAQARPDMLAAVCEGLGFEVGIVWEPSEDAGALGLIATYAAPGFEDLLSALAGPSPALRGTLDGLAANETNPIFCTDLQRDPPREGSVRDPRLRSAVGVPVHSRGGELVGVTELFASRPIDEEGLPDTLRVIGSQVAQYIERQRTEEEAQRVKDQIVSNVSHELRTPLTAIDGWVQVLLDEDPGPLNDEQRRFLTIVKRNSDRLMRLVADLLVAGQVEAGKLRLELGEVDVAALARETAELVASTAESKRIALDVHAERPVVVRGDRQRLGQLLSNLLANAIKFTPEDGSVDVRVARRDGSCRITVKDTGIGIPDSEREHLFERFYRASSATDRGISGTGLGLAISKAIAESHDGTIELADEDGSGAVFVVELPLSAREEVYT